MSAEPTARKDEEELRKRLGLEACGGSQLSLALEHPSYANEHDGGRGNERLEFLGDAVLDLVMGELLFESHPDWSEGHLTRARAALVNTRALADHARGIDLGSFVKLGKTELRDGGRDKDRILANVFEALVGAIYLSSGLEEVRRLCGELFAGALATPDLGGRRDPKTRFQEWAHAKRKLTPVYVLLEDNGVEASEKRFAVAVELAGERWGEGRGRSKRAAERAAAEAALALASTDDDEA